MFLLNEPFLEVEPNETQARRLVSISSDAAAAVTDRNDFTINTVFEKIPKTCTTWVQE